MTAVVETREFQAEAQELLSLVIHSLYFGPQAIVRQDLRRLLSRWTDRRGRCC